MMMAGDHWWPCHGVMAPGRGLSPRWLDTTLLGHLVSQEWDWSQATAGWSGWAPANIILDPAHDTDIRQPQVTPILWHSFYTTWYTMSLWLNILVIKSAGLSSPATLFTSSRPSATSFCTHRSRICKCLILPRPCLQTNDFAALLAKHKTIKHVYFNGAKAEQLYKRHVIPTLGEQEKCLPMTRLPSTSPAHAAMSFEDKIQIWKIQKQYIHYLQIIT